jgi:hypothetical protein
MPTDPIILIDLIYETFREQNLLVPELTRLVFARPGEEPGRGKDSMAPANVVRPEKQRTQMLD